MLQGLLETLSMAFGMTWEIPWALILGFTLSAAVQAVVSKSEMTRLLPNDSPLGWDCVRTPQREAHILWASLDTVLLLSLISAVS